ncbi:hypothetical protein [Streptomyces ferrugineus]|uniref:hypothetical protein n=1 Tax=Streptomyces ferrugineus TaxID=1413221 RepID=UPI002AD1D53D|nr:hypothetical protein [Streptomyces ferrugineus]
MPEQAIPDDPHGGITMGRFRRTLAWHVARRPGGLVALAIQYGHMRTVLNARTSSGYGSRSRRGIHAILDVETARAANLRSCRPPGSDRRRPHTPLRGPHRPPHLREEGSTVTDASGHGRDATAPRQYA